jgi:hypothetical protein
MKKIHFMEHNQRNTYKAVDDLIAKLEAEKRALHPEQE